VGPCCPTRTTGLPARTAAGVTTRVPYACHVCHGANDQQDRQQDQDSCLHEKAPLSVNDSHSVARQSPNRVDMSPRPEIHGFADPPLDGGARSWNFPSDYIGTIARQLKHKARHAALPADLCSHVSVKRPWGVATSGRRREIECLDVRR
jgi:hypothetical protein